MDGRRIHRTVRVLPGSRRWFISPLVEAGAEYLGAGVDVASSIAQVAGPAITGAGVGALTAGVTGGKPLYGALIGGGIGGIAGATGVAGSLSNYLGLSDLGSSAVGGVPYSDPAGAAALTAAGGTAPAGTPASLIDQFGNAILPPDQAAAAVGGAAGAAGPTTAVSAANAAGGSGLLGGGINKTSLILGALAGIGSLLGGKPQQGTWPTPGPSSNAANLGPTWNAPLNTNVPGRMPTRPTSDWYTYGQRPEQNFFSGNSLSNYGWGAPIAAARGGALGEFSTGSGEHFVRGPGTGTSDSVPARLSDGEFVLDSADVNRIGNGSNERGAAILEHDRGALAKVLGEKKFVREKLKSARRAG